MNTRKSILLIALGLLIIVVALALRTALAKAPEAPAAQGSPLHPTFALLDADGINVLTSGEPVSTMQTCGQCHDTEFIAGHSFHADMGLSTYDPLDHSLTPGVGQFGKWDPFAYRFLSQPGDALLDLGTPEWLTLFGAGQAGGGPAVVAREGQPLLSLRPSANDPEASVLDPATGRAVAWDWSQSGDIEMNCFLCHLASPDNASRAEAIQSGDFAWANTATLLNSGIVNKTVAGWVWMPSAFDSDGVLRDGKVSVQDPTNENCAQCHTMAHTEDEPLVLASCDAASAPTGEVISGQRISDSGMNIQDKEMLARSWDIHAERQLQCTDCHFSQNNPARQLAVSGENPTHLIYDPRRLDIGEYLEQPDHNLARGQSAQYNVAPELKGSMRRCESCHDAEESHTAWLPYVERHMDEVACETCHIPQVYAPAAQSYDWTVVRLDGAAQTACRGVATGAGSGGGEDTVNELVSGYDPVLLQRRGADGGGLLAPYNLISAWYWVYDDPNGNTRPVRQIDLQAAYLKDGEYAPEVLSTFDRNDDGALDESELEIDSEAKQTLIAARLAALGLREVRIQAQTLPFSLNHGVARGEYAINDCETCHARDSRVAQPIKLADSVPGGVIPQFSQANNVAATGEMIQDADGALYYQPVARNDKLYVMGSSSVSWVDRLGALFFVAVLAGAAGHGTMRFVASARKPRGGDQTDGVRTGKVYLYGKYERFWHWLQTILIILLLFTGLIIHRPDIFGMFAFRNMVLVHNILGAILVANAALSLFYHLTTGHIRQFIPRPYGFFDQAIVQARYYTRGIFRGDPHPFDKTPDRKMNPLQQVTYFGILMVLLPLQTITGILMWGVQRWPQIAEPLGGLTFLAPLHTLLAWLFAAFIAGHVYLITTGTTPLESMRGMVTGWEDVERHEAA